VNIVFISGFLSPNSKGGPALRAKNSLAIMQRLGNVKAFDLETISRFSWSGGETRPKSRERLGPWVVADWVSQYFHTAISRLLQITEIFTQLVSVSTYFKLRRFIQDASPDIVWFSYASDYPKLFVLLRRRFPLVPFVADTQAVVSTHLKRAVEEMSGIRRLVYKNLAREKLKHENIMMSEASITTAVSEVDLDEYRSRAQSNRLALFPNVVATSPLQRSEIQKAKVPTILITGTFGGEEGAMTHGTLWFLREVFPNLLRKVPDLKVNRVGRNAVSLRDFTHIPDEVTVEADVSSLAPYFLEAWCSVCPLFFESGTRFKILEASERAVPTVSTGLGAEGLDFEHERHILIADTPDEFTSALIRVLGDTQLRSTLGEESRAILEQKYSLGAGTEAVKRILDRCIPAFRLP
jgi:glycosyltransferase involved in cell wall biosynthesis